MSMKSVQKFKVQELLDEGATMKQIAFHYETTIEEVEDYISFRGMKRRYKTQSMRNPLNQMARDYLASISDLNRLIFNKAW